MGAVPQQKICHLHQGTHSNIEMSQKLTTESYGNMMERLVSKAMRPTQAAGWQGSSCSGNSPPGSFQLSSAYNNSVDTFNNVVKFNDPSSNQWNASSSSF